MRLAFSLILFLSTPVFAAPYDVVEKDIATLQTDMTAGRVTAVELVQAYQARIAAIDKSGPTLNSVIALNPQALAQAAALDTERKAKGVRGPLHGIPILVKDNIEAAELPTTAGSLALANNRTGRDAPVVARLRSAGVIILGKTNLSEWAISAPALYQRLVWHRRAGEEPLCAGPQRLRFVGRQRRSGGSEPGGRRPGQRDQWFAGLSRFAQRRGVAQAHGGPGVAHPYHSHFPHPGHRRSHDPQRGRCCPAACGHGGQRSGRSRDRPRRCPGARLCGGRRHACGQAAGCAAACYRHRSRPRFSGCAQSPGSGGGADRAGDRFHPAAGQQRRRNRLAADRVEERPEQLSRNIACGPAQDLGRYYCFQHSDAARAGAVRTGHLRKITGAPGPCRSLISGDAGAAGAGHAGAAGTDLRAIPSRCPGPAHQRPCLPYRPCPGQQQFRRILQRSRHCRHAHLTLPMGMVRGLPVGISLSGLAWSEAPLLALGAAFEKILPARKAPQFLPSLEDTPQSSAAFAPQR